MLLLTLNLLGSFQACLDEGPILDMGIKAKALLIYLAAEADRPQRRESLMALLWPRMPRCEAKNYIDFFNAICAA